MEVLSDILNGLRASGSVYFCDSLESPWELPYRNEDKAMFHLVRRGRCCLDIAGKTYKFKPGDFVFFAPRIDHRVYSEPVTDSDTMLLCGYCQFEAAENDILVRSLPEFMLLRHAELEQWPWITRTLKHLGAEFMSAAPGSDVTVNKLTEVLLVQLLRADFGRSDHAGITAALKDKRITSALTRIHEHPENRWTIASAAAAASMSRSGFARKFKELLNVSFFDYLTQLRMRNARELLTATELPVALVGERVGYRSDLSFVKAFKKLHGMTPRGYRLNL